MKKAIAWEIGEDGKPKRLVPGAVDLERHLEDWVDEDPAIVADDVLLIGRQVNTVWGTTVDLLGIDEDGNLVVIELKREQTLRETVAQALEYSAWASKLGYEQIVEIAAKRWGGREKFLDAFTQRFETGLPESVNAVQRILVVAPNIDDATSDVIDYLATTYRMPINAVSFDVFGSAPRQTLVRHFVLEGTQLSATPPNAKARPTRTIEEVMQLATDLGVGAIAEPLLELTEFFAEPPSVNKSGWTYYPPIGHELQGHAALSVILTHYSVPVGSVGLALKDDNLAGTLNLSPEAREALVAGLPGKQAATVRRGSALFVLASADEAGAVVDSFRKALSAEETLAEAVGAIAVVAE